MESRDEIDFIVLTSDEIDQRVHQLGERITRDFQDRPPLIIGVLRGCVVFVSDLIRAVGAPLELDFLAVESYRQSTSTSGVVRVLKDLDEDIDGRDVVLVEDIVDSGLTLNYLLGYLRAHDPASIHICVLLNKPERREVDVPIDYLGFEVPNRFLVGYGLDYAQRYRNLPYIAALSDEAIE